MAWSNSIIMTRTQTLSETGDPLRWRTMSTLAGNDDDNDNNDHYDDGC